MITHFAACFQPHPKTSSYATESHGALCLHAITTCTASCGQVFTEITEQSLLCEYIQLPHPA